MKIIIKTDRYALPLTKRKNVGSMSDAEIIHQIRRHVPYGPEWELVKAVSKKLVFRRGQEISMATYTIEN